jgi:hypothetical protein
MEAAPSVAWTDSDAEIAPQTVQENRLLQHRNLCKTL